MVWGDKIYGPTSWAAKQYGATSWGAKAYGATSWGAKAYGATAWSAKQYGATAWGAWSYTDQWNPWQSTTSRSFTGYSAWSPDTALTPLNQTVTQTRTAYYTDTTSSTRSGTRYGNRTGTRPWTQSGSTAWTRSGTAPWTQTGTAPWTRSGTTLWTRTGTQTSTRTGTEITYYVDTGEVISTRPVSESASTTVSDSGTDPASATGTDAVSRSGSDAVSDSGSDPVQNSGTDTVSDSSTTPIRDSNTANTSGSLVQTQTVNGGGPIPVTFVIGNLVHTYNGTPRAVTVAPSLPAATYALTYDAAGYPPTGTAPTNAGTYNARVVATGQYTGAANATLLVGKAALTVRANDQTRTYGDANSPLTAAITGFVAGESTAVLSGAPALATEAATTSNVGSYPISCAAGTLAAANYSFTYADGQLVIMPKPVTFTFGNLNAAYDGVVKSATASPSDGAATYTADLTKGPQPGTYPVSATATGNFRGSGQATLLILPPAQAVTLAPLESRYTVADPSSPLNGQSYGRLWQQGGWTAYLGRAGVRFSAHGEAWPAVQRVELQAKAPDADWTVLATETPMPAASAAEVTFSVALGGSAPGQPLVPLSYYEGSPQTGEWRFRARVQDTNGGWGTFSPEVPVQVVLPIASKSLSGQTVPPAGDLGGWFTASPVQTYSVQMWVP